MTNGDGLGNGDDGPDTPPEPPVRPYGTSNVPSPITPPPPPPPPAAPPAPPPSAPGYAAPYPTAPPSYYPRSRTSGLAVSSLVLGILGFFFVTAILAVIFGHVSLSQIKRSLGAISGRGMAIAGLVLGYLWLAFFVVIIVLAATGVIQTATEEECRNDRFALFGAEEAYFAAEGHYTDQSTLRHLGYLDEESDLYSVRLLGGDATDATDYNLVAGTACS